MFDTGGDEEEGAGFYDATDTFAITPTERELRNQGYVRDLDGNLTLHYPEDEPAAHILATVEPCGDAAVAAEYTAADTAVLTDAELIDTIIGFDRLTRWVHAHQARLISAFAHRRPGDEPAAVSCPTTTACSRWAPDELGLALGVGRQHAKALLAQSVALTQVLPDTLTALHTGRIDLAKARALTDLVGVLSPEQARAVEARVLPKAGEQTQAQFRGALRRAILRIDPDGANRRHAEARGQRRVVVSPDEEGMSTLWALLPATDAATGWQMLTRLARSLGPQDSRSLDERRADLLVDLITGRLTLTTDTADSNTDDDRVGDTGDDDRDGDIAASHPASDSDTSATATASDTSATAGDSGAGDSGTADRGSAASGTPASGTPANDTCGTATAGFSGAGSDTSTADTRSDAADSGAAADTSAADTGSDTADHAGDHDTADAADHDTADAGDHDTADAGDHDTADAGDHDTADAGDHDTADAGDHDTADAGDHDTADAGDHDTADAADHDTADRGEAGSARPGTVACRHCGSSNPATRTTQNGKPLIHIVVGLDTLTGTQDLPAELVGYGPIPSDLARTAATDAVWKRLITDPLSGALLDHGRTTYRPPAALDDFIKARDVTCRFPICNRRAIDCDLDHLQRWADGGDTDEANLHGFCGQHHALKELPGWQVIAHPDGTLTWITPTGHQHVSHPHDYRDYFPDEPAPPPEPELPPPTPTPDPPDADPPPPF